MKKKSTPYLYRKMLVTFNTLYNTAYELSDLNNSNITTKRIGLKNYDLIEQNYSYNRHYYYCY